MSLNATSGRPNSSPTADTVAAARRPPKSAPLARTPHSAAAAASSRAGTCKKKKGERPTLRQQARQHASFVNFNVCSDRHRHRLTATCKWGGGVCHGVGCAPPGCGAPGPPRGPRRSTRRRGRRAAAATAGGRGRRLPRWPLPRPAPAKGRPPGLGPPRGAGQARASPAARPDPAGPRTRHERWAVAGGSEERLAALGLLLLELPILLELPQWCRPATTRCLRPGGGRSGRPQSAARAGGQRANEAGWRQKNPGGWGSWRRRRRARGHSVPSKHS